MNRGEILYYLNSINICKNYNYIINLYYGNYIDISKKYINESDLCRCIYFDVCRGGIYINNLWCRMPVSHKIIK